MGDYLIRVPAADLHDGISGGRARISTGDPFDWTEPYAVVAEIPGDATAIHVTFDRPLQPGETRYGEGGNSVHMHSGPDCPCGWKLGGNGGYVGNAAPNLRFPTTANWRSGRTPDRPGESRTGRGRGGYTLRVMCRDQRGEAGGPRTGGSAVFLLPLNLRVTQPQVHDYPVFFRSPARTSAGSVPGSRRRRGSLPA